MKIIKTKRLTRILGCLLALVLTLSLATPALAVPQIPHQFWGQVTIGGQLATEGTVVSAEIDGLEYASTTVDAQGRYGYLEPGGTGIFRVPADDPDLSGKDGAYAGDLIEFYVADALATTFTFQIGGHDLLNLTVTTETFTITATAGEGGTISPSGDVVVNSGASQVFTITPSEGYEIADVLVDSVSVGAVESYLFENVTADHTIDASFALQPFTITATAGAGGSIEPSGDVVVNSGASQAFTITPGTGYEIADVLVDSVSVGAVESYLFENVTADHTIDASFAPTETFTITATAGEGGSIEPSGDVVVNSGASQAFTITPGTGYEIADVLVDGASVLGELVDNTYTFENVTADHTIDASFVPTETFTITATAGDNGTISPSGDVVVNSGASQAFTISPDTGYAVDDVLVDGISVGAVSSYTFVNVTAGHTIHATFAEVIGNLGELVDETEPGGTLELEAGTYSGDVTIDKPLTITGTVGTIVSGGIHIVPLVGSNVTIEYLTITDYTDYGIWIEMVRADDVFIIRNNTIEGVEGSVIGIQVDEVVSGGNLTIRENAISGNEIGVKLLAAVADGGIEFNDITGNTIGLEQLAEVFGAYAGYNWWGDVSGPGEENQNPGGIGDNVTGNIGYDPWLTREFQTVLEDNIAYFGGPMVNLNTGWNIISTPVALDPLVEWVDSDNISRTGVDTWGDYVALGDGLSTDNTSPAYRFDAENQAWVGLTSDDTLDPCDAIYVRMAEPDIAPILYSPDVSVPSKELYAGWNLVSLAWLPSTEIYGMPADEALVTVEEVSGGFTGYKLVVSPGMSPNESTWIYIAGGPIDPWTDPELPPPDGWMITTSGYWVFMLNDGTLAGFTFTPVSLSMPSD